MEFRRYMHIERYGNDEVHGIELGRCYVFPKLDGTNASLWWDDGVKAGSRNRELSIDNDNAGFYQWALDNENIEKFLKSHMDLRIYGEWLVPHTLKTYRPDVWRKFYVFDVYSETECRYLSYDEYSVMLEENGFVVIPPLCIIKNATYDNLLKELNANTYLIEDGNGAGEGVVIKNYEYQNRFKRTTWAKIVRNEFKEKNKEKFGPAEKHLSKMVEQEIADGFVTQHLVDKVYSKIVNEMEGWNSKYIPRLLNTVFHDLVSEEIWDIVKKMKNPTINFKRLNSLAILKIKELKPELF